MRNKKLKEIKAEKYEEKEEVEIKNNIKVVEFVEDEYDDYSDTDTYDENIDDEYEEKIDKVIEKKSGKKKKPKPLVLEEIEEPKEEYEEANKTFRKATAEKIMKVFNYLFIILIIIMILVSVDIICVSKYNVGPFFAINTDTYDDGGTKVYYGLGYKVIKYNQIMGRKDTQLGNWSMPYSTSATEIEDIDLAIEFQNNPEKTAEKYYKQYIKILTKVKKVDQKKNKLILEYTDPDGKYTLQIDCPVAMTAKDLTNIKENQELSATGTIIKFSLKDEKRPNTVYITDCFIR